MIIYKSTASEFIDTVREGKIDYVIHKNFQEKLGRRTGQREVESWQGSLPIMRDVLELADCPKDAKVTIECQIPNTSKRIDFIVSGSNAACQDTAVVVELKGWSHAQKTKQDAVVKTPLAGGIREVTHPSYQAWSYVDLLKSFNSSVEENNIQLEACAFVHNCESPSELNDEFYQEHILKAPIFFKRENRKLSEFIRQHIKYGDNKNIIELLENGKIRPTKSLASSVNKLLEGKKEFILIDDQKLVYEKAAGLIEKYERSKSKQILIVEGGPGTGKSVVAVNLLANLTGKQYMVKYISKNAAPREVYAEKLKGYRTKSSVDNLFGGSGSFIEERIDPNIYEMLIIDEAHRLNEKSGLYGNLGENQIKEIIRASKTCVFFIDEKQRIAFSDIGSLEEIDRWASFYDAEVERITLRSQFRCAGSDGYLSWLDNVLQVRETANLSLDSGGFDFKVFDDINLMHEVLEQKNITSNSTMARIVAGYCWRWKSKKDSNAMDVRIDSQGYAKQWNLAQDGSRWIVNPESMEQIGCIHTCQGLEIPFIGVIIGPDLIVRNGEVLTDATKRDRHDKTIKGFKTQLKNDSKSALKKADEIIKNTYRTLMTRGMQGCYVFSEDRETREWFTTNVF